MRSILLEDLAREMGVFISQLHDPAVNARVLSFLGRLSLERYSVEQWNYCFAYLFSDWEDSFRFSSVYEVGIFLRGIRQKAI